MDIFIGITAALGSALVGGIFYGFSSFIMTALGRIPPAEGVRAMQSINFVVLNRSFFGVFFGTAVLGLAALGLALLHWTQPWAVYYCLGSVFYLIGVIGITIAGNVPLNDKLAKASADDPATQTFWQTYITQWTAGNTTRTAAALLASLFFLFGLLR